MRLSGNTFYLTQCVPDLCAGYVMGVISEPVATEIIKYLEVLESVQCQQYHGLSTPNNIFFLKLSSVHAFPLLELLFFYVH